MSGTDHHFDRDVSDRLRLLRRNLQIVHDGIVVAALALRQQNADRDREIAQVLEFLVGDRLAEQVERAGELLAVLGMTEPWEEAEHRQLHPEDGDDRHDEPHEVREPDALWARRPGDVQHADGCGRARADVPLKVAAHRAIGMAISPSG